MNTFFAQQTVLPGADTSVPDEASLPHNDHSFSTLSTTPVEVFDALAALHEGKAPGLDGLPPGLLNFCAPGIAVSLSALFNRSFSAGYFPSAWKSALVVPVFKKGSRDCPGNYRPIALLPILSKTMERIVHNKVYSFLRPWFNHHQSGFKKRDGTVPQLIRLVQQWSEALDRSEYVGVIYFDLKKAFDRVWHRGLLAKLRAAGITGQAYAWFSSFLSSRQQATVVDGSMSEFSALHAGVPQGAILSPLLFSIYVNDVPSCNSTGGSTNLFADDTSLFTVDQDVSTLSTKMQSCVDSLSAWFDRWLLTVNTAKSAVMVIRSKRKPPVSLSVSIKGCVLPQTPFHRHLGLVVNDTLTWSTHVDSIVSKASSRIGLLRRLKCSTSPLVVRDLYLYCVRPVIEYAQVAWAGLSAIDEKRLERINRSAARLISNTRLSAHLPHQLLLARAGLEPLKVRRQVAQALFVRRLLSGRLPPHLQVATDPWILLQPQRRGHSMDLRNGGCLRLPRPKKTVLKLSPLYSSFSIWNSLPQPVRSSPSRDQFLAFFSD